MNAFALQIDLEKKEKVFTHSLSPVGFVVMMQITQYL